MRWGEKRRITDEKQAAELRRMMYPDELPPDVEPAEMIDPKAGEELHIIVELEESQPKGVCPKCLKHIGRGVHFHAKKCKGQ